MPLATVGQGPLSEGKVRQKKRYTLTGTATWSVISLGPQRSDERGLALFF